MDLSRPSSLPSRSQVGLHLPFDSLASVARLSPPFTGSDGSFERPMGLDAGGGGSRCRPTSRFIPPVGSINPRKRGRLSGNCSGQNQTVDIPFPPFFILLFVAVREPLFERWRLFECKEFLPLFLLFLLSSDRDYPQPMRIVFCSESPPPTARSTRVRRSFVHAREERDEFGAGLRAISTGRR